MENKIESHTAKGRSAMLRFSSTIIGVAAASFAVSVHAQPTNEPLYDQVGQVISTYLTDFNDKRDAAAIAGLYTTDTVRVTPQGVASGREQVQTSYEGYFKLGFTHDDVSLDKVMPLGPSAIIAIGEYHTTGQGKNGPLDARGRWTTVWVRQGDAWRAILETIVANPPPTSAAPAASSAQQR
jgi:uncharacterized protein (TIGR02246 family)